MPYLYIIQEQDRFKIGQTNNYKQRFNRLQTSSSRYFKLILVLELKSKEKVVLLEKSLHELFSNKHITREWFYLNYKEDKQIIINYTISSFDYTIIIDEPTYKVSERTIDEGDYNLITNSIINSEKAFNKINLLFKSLQNDYDKVINQRDNLLNKKLWTQEL